MYGFDETHLIVRTPPYTLWRRPALVGLELRGLLDDAASDGWRRAVGDEFKRAGYPRFYAMDARTVRAESSIAARYRSAVFVRESLQALEWAVVYVASAQALVVVRAVLRLAGLGNCTLVGTEPEFDRAIDEMRAGRAPKVGWHALPVRE